MQLGGVPDKQEGRSLNRKQILPRTPLNGGPMIKIFSISSLAKTKVMAFKVSKGKWGRPKGCSEEESQINKKEKTLTENRCSQGARLMEDQ